MKPYIERVCAFALSAATALPQWGCVTAGHKTQEALFEGQHLSEKRYLEVVLEAAYRGGVPEIRLADLNIFYTAGDFDGNKQDENCNYVAIAIKKDLNNTVVPFSFPEPPIAEIFRPDGTIEGIRETETVPKKVKMFFPYDDDIEVIDVISVKGYPPHGWSFSLTDHAMETEPKPRQDPNCSYREEMKEKMLEMLKKDMEKKRRGR